MANVTPGYVFTSAQDPITFSKLNLLGNPTVTIGAGEITPAMISAAAWASPGAIGSTTPNTGAFTTLTASLITGTEAGTGSGNGGVIAATANAGGNAAFGWYSNSTARWIADISGSADAEMIRFRKSGTGAATYMSLSTTGVSILSALAMPAGGTTGSGVKISSVTNFGVFFGSGPPTLSAGQGSLYLRSDGTTTNDRAYINTTGSTTWTALITAA